MKTRRKKKLIEEAVEAFIYGLALFALLFIAMEQVHANSPEKIKSPDQAQQQQQAQQQAQEQTQEQAQTASSVSSSDSVSSASNDGNTLQSGDVSIGGDQVENNSSNVVLVPNNNTESCVRVFGLAFGKNGESGALGVPWRSKACDYEQAADDAFAAGERELGWFWKCQNKNLYKIFIRDGIDADEAKNICHQKAVGEIGNMRTIENLQRRLDASEEYTEFLKSHKDVCDESLTRCEKESYGGK